MTRPFVVLRVRVNLVHVNFTRVNEIEATYEVFLLNVK